MVLMKILFVTRGFPTDNNAMIGIYEAVQAKVLASKGCQVSVIAISRKSTRYLFCNNRVTYRKVDGVDVYEFNWAKISDRFKFLRWFESSKAIGYRKAFNKYVKEKGLPDVVHAHIIMYANYVSFVKTEFHLPFVITEHWTQMNKTGVSEQEKRMAQAYRYADRVICVSQALSDSLKRNFQVNSIVINNMVGDEFFKSIREKRNDKTFKFIAVGVFRHNKRFDILVDAFSKCCFPVNVTLDIVGDGEERELIENKIKEHHLSDQVHLFGIKTSTEVSELLCHSDCFVLSSKLETFAIVVIEAMAKGLPVIATRCGGPETFLRPEHGILVEKENIGALSDAMTYMVKHYADYHSDIIRDFCHSHFSQDVIADRIIEVYRQVI